MSLRSSTTPNYVRRKVGDWLMVKFKLLEVPPPGPGLATVTLDVPAVATSLAGIAAANCVALTNEVVRALPFHCTVAPLTKFVPLTVRVKFAAPANVLDGERLIIVGTGFCA